MPQCRQQRRAVAGLDDIASVIAQVLGDQRSQVRIVVGNGNSQRHFQAEATPGLRPRSWNIRAHASIVPICHSEADAHTPGLPAAIIERFARWVARSTARSRRHQAAWRRGDERGAASNGRLRRRRARDRIRGRARRARRGSHVAEREVRGRDGHECRSLALWWCDEDPCRRLRARRRRRPAGNRRGRPAGARPCSRPPAKWRQAERLARSGVDLQRQERARLRAVLVDTTPPRAPSIPRSAARR